MSDNEKEFDWEKFSKEQTERKKKAEEERRRNNDALRRQTGKGRRK